MCTVTVLKCIGCGSNVLVMTITVGMCILPLSGRSSIPFMSHFRDSMMGVEFCIPSTQSFAKHIVAALETFE